MKIFDKYLFLFNKHRHSKILILVTFVVLVLSVYAVLFWRYPNNVTYPNFYAEDGSVFLQNVIDKGWIEATFTPFNGYGIVGLYLITGLGWLINLLFFSASFINLPATLSLASILFMSVVICLPFLLFSSSFGRRATFIVVLCSALLPLPLSPHIVIGTVGNQKWIFFYLAFLLAVYRIINYRNLSTKKVALIDLSLLISAYTNVTTYFLIPILYLPYLSDFLRQRKKSTILSFVKVKLKEQETRSLIILTFLLIPQVLYVLLNGIPKLAGYLDTPFNPDRAIELFINRTFLFGITYPINNYLNDLLVLIVFMALLILAWKYLGGKSRFVFFTGIYAAGVGSLLFVINRTGISDFFFGYTSAGSGPDQFFYTQTLIMYLPLVLFGFAFLKKIKKENIKNVILMIFIGIIIFNGLVANSVSGEQWRNASPFENDAGIFTDRVLDSCSSPENSAVSKVVVYPYASGQFSILAPRKAVCTEALKENYQLSTLDLGLRVNNNDYLSATSDKVFTQTFLANQGNLNGIRLFISTFGKNSRNGDYQFLLFNETCEEKLRDVSIPNQILDNSYFNVRFEPLKESNGKIFCFKLDAPGGFYDPIAVQLSKSDVYNEGILKIQNNTDARDVVFLPLFNRVK
jgi:hypothetical protein